MSLLIESIKLLDGKFFNLSYHEERMRKTLSSLFGITEEPTLGRFLAASNYPGNGLYKCRIVYDSRSRKVSFDPYEARNIGTVKVVEDEHITYPFKFADREAINRLYERRGVCDDVLIVKNGRVTDCSYSNIAFRKNSDWFTPGQPLLKGTMRQKLLDENKITEREILLRDLRSFDSFKIINAMLEFESPEIEVSKIVF